MYSWPRLPMMLSVRQPIVIASVFSIGLGLGACKDDAPETAPDGDAPAPQQTPTDEARPDPSQPAAGQPTAGLGTETAALIESAAAAAANTPLLPHDGVVGHVFMPGFQGTLDKVRDQLAPPAVAGMVNGELMKTMAAGEFGSHSAVVRNVDLAKPMGCAIVDSTAVELPLACVIGYTGGAEGLVTDLGAQGRASDAKGHVGLYEIDGQEVYIDALGEQVVMTNHAELFDLAKAYLQSTLIDRREDAIADVEVVVYVNDAMKRFRREFKPLLDEFASNGESMPGMPAETFEEALARFEQTEQFMFGVGLESEGAFLRWAIHATKGSEFQTVLDSTYAGPMDDAFVAKMPQGTFALAGMHLATGATESKLFKRMQEKLAEEYSAEAGHPPEELKAEIDAFFAEEAALYAPDVAAGLTFLKGTLGAAVLEVRKKKSGREGWKSWSTRFLPKAVLGEKAARSVTWKFEPDATVVDGVPVDRWTIEPTAEGLAELRKDSDFATIESRWKTMSFTIDRAEVDDRVLFVLSPRDADAYVEAAITAAKGQDSLADDPGFTALKGRLRSVAAVYAFDVAGGARWLRELLPADKASEIPPELGVNLSDVYITVEHPAPGSYAGEFFVSQPFIEQLRKLAN